MKSSVPAKQDRKQTIINYSLAIVAGQVGCLTLAVIVIALLGGLWLDKQFDSKPLYTLILFFISIPVSLFLMFAVAKAAIAKIKIQTENQKQDQSEEEGQFGERRNEDT